MATFILLAHRERLAPEIVKASVPPEAAPPLDGSCGDAFTLSELLKDDPTPRVRFRRFVGTGDTQKSDVSAWHRRVAEKIARHLNPPPLEIVCHSRPFTSNSAVPPPPPRPWVFTVEELRTLKTKLKARLTIQPPESGSRTSKWDVEIPVPKTADLEEARWYFAAQRKDLLAGKSVRKRAENAEATMHRWGVTMFKCLFENPDASFLWRKAVGQQLLWNLEGTAKFHRLPWEWLRDTVLGKDDALALQHPFRRRITSFAPLEARVSQGEPLQVLWVSARPSRDPIGRDTVYTKVQQAVSGKVIFHRIENGSYEEMIRALRKHKGRPRFHCLHLDMHGMVGTTDDLHRRGFWDPADIRQADRAGRGRLREHQTETAFLFFEEGGLVDPVTAAELATEIRSAQVPMVLLNACESALVPPEAMDSALAAHLVEAGVYSALGFQQSISVVGAQRFYSGFYDELSEGFMTSGVHDRAVLAGRDELRSRKDRGGGLHLIDWSLPVWYLAREFVSAAASAT